MNRRETVLALAALGVAPRIATAQERTVRIGVLVGRRNSTFMPKLLKRLGELGYVEGRNLAVEYRSADGVPERFPPLARDLIEAKCDVIFAIGAPQAAQALVAARSPVPVVIIANDYDPVKAGIVLNLRHPGGNLTGVFLSQIELSAKRLELMRAILPAAARYLVLGDAFTQDQLDATRQVATKLRVEIIAETFASPPYDIEAAIAKNRTPRVDALIVLTSPQLFDQRARISESAMKQKLPASVGYPAAGWGEAGFLIAYAAEQDKLSARAAEMAVSILKGAKPGDIPIERATKFDLIINLKTAKALGIKIPQQVLQRADRVIG